jgi:serine/threonine protein kinase
MSTVHSLSTIREVFSAVTVALRKVRPLLPDLGDFISALIVSIKRVYISDDTTVAEAELQAALRSALAFLDKVHSDAGPLLFFRRGSLGYELAEIVRGLRNAASKTHAAGLSAHGPTFDVNDASPVIEYLTRTETELRDDTKRFFAVHGGDLAAMLAACGDHPRMMSLLHAVEDPRVLIQRLSDDGASRHVFELHYDDVDIDMKEVTKKGRVYHEKVLIGKGAFGHVYKGRYLGVPVAVKEFPSETASIINAFESEVAILCALRHPNILPIIGFTRGDRTEDAEYTLITPLLAQKFTEVIADPSYSPKRRLRWCLDIASALVYLHGREPAVRHGDLKPANVMLDAAGNAVLLDFGLATSRMTTTLPSRGSGFTPAYAAPEVQAGGARTAAADIFAFGLLLYEIWHGRPWYEGINLRGHASHVDFLRAGLTPPLSPHAMPAFMASLIAQCLVASASRRPNAAEVMQKFRIATAPSGAAARRADSLAEGDPTPFNPLPDGYTPHASAAAAFAALMADDPPERVVQLVDAIQLKTCEVLHEVGTARGQSEDEVFAIVAFTSDVRPLGIDVERNVWRRLNVILRKRDLQGFAPFADYYWYLSQGLSKIPLEPPTTLWRGQSEITLEHLGPRYTVGRRVCFLNFTSTSTHKDVMKDFATTTPGAPGVMLRIEACEGRSIQLYSLGASEAEVLLAPNALCEVTVALGMDAVEILTAFPGAENLPQRTALVTLKQLPTPIPVIASLCAQAAAVTTDDTFDVHSPSRSPLGLWIVRILCTALLIVAASSAWRLGDRLRLPWNAAAEHDMLGKSDSRAFDDARSTGAGDQAFFELANTPSALESVNLPDDRTRTPRDLYIKAIRDNSAYSAPYVDLAHDLAPDESITLPDGRIMKQRELYLEAIRHNGTNSAAYYSLACLLTAAESVTLPHGRAMNKRQLYLEAIRHDRTNSRAYSRLALGLVFGGSVTLPDGRKMNQRELYLEAIRHNGTDALPHNNLAYALAPDESITLPNGRAMNQRELYLEAIRHDSNCAQAYVNLVNCLTNDEDSVTLPDGRTMQQRGLYLEAIHRDRKSLAYNSLASLLAADEVITLLDGRTVSQLDLRREALS